MDATGKLLQVIRMEKKMTVLQINALGKTNSTGRTTREMHDYFCEHGILSYLATARNQDCEDAFAISNKASMRIDSLCSIITGLDGYFSILETRKFLKYLDSIQPDIVHLRILHNSYINLKMLCSYLAKRNIPTVITLHDMWYVTGKCCVYGYIPCDKWMTGCGKCPAMSMDARKKWFDRTEKMWRDKKEWLCRIPRLAVIGNSEWTMKEAEKSFLRDASIVDFVYNWIDHSVFYPRKADYVQVKLGLEQKKIILSVASYWYEHDKKGFDRILELAKKMPEEYAIVLVGNVEYQGVLPSGILSISTTNNTSELAEYYSAADVYLNLSSSETFGKVSAEALSCGTPVIALNNTANPEIVPPNGGLVIDSADVDVILGALQQIFEKPKSCYAQICVDYARAMFDKDRNIEKYLDIYERLIDIKEK